MTNRYLEKIALDRGVFDSDGKPLSGAAEHLANKAQQLNPERHISRLEEKAKDARSEFFRKSNKSAVPGTRAGRLLQKATGVGKIGLGVGVVGAGAYALNSAFKNTKQKTKA